MNEMIRFLREDAALRHHLTHSHYPPVHSIFITVARDALKIARRAKETENWETMEDYIELPNGLEKTVWEIVEELHLEKFI